MSTQPSGFGEDVAPDGPLPRRRAPWWLWIALLVLFGGGYALNELRSAGGPPVAWIEGDIASAIHAASSRNQLVFLYLFEPGTPAADRNEREVFTKRWARAPLAQMVCCRRPVQRNDETAIKYGYQNQPLFLVLDAEGKEVNRTAGTPEERQFYTYVSQTLEHKPQPRRD